MPTKLDELMGILRLGHEWTLPNKEYLRNFLSELFEERYHKQDWKHFQSRPSYMTGGEDSASYAGWILAENPPSGAYQGTCFVWFPGEKGSVAILGIGTGGFGSDTHILGRAGHRRRLKALGRVHHNKIWIKPDPLDLESAVPEVVHREWPRIEAALKAYDKVIYAAVPVREGNAQEREAVEDLMDLFAHEHQIRMKGSVKQRWDVRIGELIQHVFPHFTEDKIVALLNERRFVILQGPPGTGKTSVALKIAKKYGTPTVVQFHPAKTYEDFVVGLAPRPVEGNLQFHVRKGDLVRANECAAIQEHVLVIDEINRADLPRVLGEAIILFESGEPDRRIELPHEIKAGDRYLKLESKLRVLGTLNTADKSITRIDLAIRRRFAFVDIWPDLEAVQSQGVPIAIELFEDTVDTFTEHVDEAGLNLVPGHAYFLDPRPELPVVERESRVCRRLKYELLPLLRAYVDERLLGPATAEIEGLSARIMGKLGKRGQ